jgi:hypothetical protein
MATPEHIAASDRTAAHTLQLATIMYLSTQENQCLPGDRHLFHPPRLKAIRTSSASTQKRWIRAVRCSIQRAQVVNSSISLPVKLEQPWLAHHSDGRRGWPPSHKGFTTSPPDTFKVVSQGRVNRGAVDFALLLARKSITLDKFQVFKCSSKVAVLIRPDPQTPDWRAARKAMQRTGLECTPTVSATWFIECLADYRV